MVGPDAARLELGPATVRGSAALAAAGVLAKRGRSEIAGKLARWRARVEGRRIFGALVAEDAIRQAGAVLGGLVPAPARARDDLRLAAGHEAGHCLADALLAHRPLRAAIWIAPGGGWVGAVWPPPASAVRPVRDRRETARALLLALAGAAGAVLAVGPSGLRGAHHEVLAAEQLARAVAPDRPASETMVLAHQVVTALLQRHRKVFDRLRRNLERHHVLDRRRLGRLLRNVPHDEGAVDLLLDMLDGGTNPTETETTP